MLTLDKTPRLTLKKTALPETIYLPFIVPHVTLSQVYSALRKQTITICASFWRYRASGYCYINANGITKRVSSDDFFSIQQNAEKRYSFWNDGEKAGSAATVRKCFLIGFGV